MVRYLGPTRIRLWLGRRIQRWLSEGIIDCSSLGDKLCTDEGSSDGLVDEELCTDEGSSDGLVDGS
jgi:hypothetical protein